MMVKKLLRKRLGIFILVALAFSACGERQKSNVSAPGVEEERPDQEGWNSTIISTKDGQVDAVINYAHMERFSKRQTVEFDDGVKVDFYDAKGNHTSTLTARGGRYLEADNSVMAQGNVVIVSDSGVTLYTEQIQWDQKKQKVFSNEFVTITTAEGDTLSGTGFISDPELENYEFYQPRGVSAQKVDLKLEDDASKRRQARPTASDSARSAPDSVSSSGTKK